MTIRVDDRTKEEKETHKILITATDRFMSGWGLAEGEASKVAWACKPEHAEQVKQWVSSRDEMQYVNYASDPWYPNVGHVHIYVVHDGHPALN